MGPLLSQKAGSLPTIVEALRNRGNSSGSRLAFRFLRYRAAGVPDEECLTYHQLLARAEAIAESLQGICAPGDRALIVCPPGLDYISGFFGCLLAGVVAVPAYPPRNSRHLERLRAIADDCSASVVLAVRETEARLPQHDEDGWRHIIYVETALANATGRWRDPGLKPSNLALLQYTSGTTNTPKGVMVSHANLQANWVGSTRAGFTEQDVLVSWLPPYHDLGLIGCIVQPVFGGHSSTLMTPAAFLQDPRRWLRALSDYRATVTMAPNFAFEMCQAASESDDLGLLDLSPLRYAIMGGEPVRPDTLTRFASRFRSAGFRPTAFAPGYGLAETTLQVTMTHVDAEPAVVLEPGDRNAGTDDGASPIRGTVSNGPPIEGHDLRIVDPETFEEMPAGEAGEVWVSGPTITLGYWNRPDQTASTFNFEIAKQEGSGPFLRTGDLGRLIAGELHVFGRMKEMIIIRGRNHYPSDIEATVAACHPELDFDSTIAFGVESPDGEGLVIVQGLSRKTYRTLDAHSIFTAIRRAVIDAHDVSPAAIVLVRPGTLPRTTSGKPQRLKARTQYIAGTLPIVARSPPSEPLGAQGKPAPIGRSEASARILAEPAIHRRSTLLRYLADQVRQALGSNELIDDSTGFADLGIDSFRAVQLSQRLNTVFGFDPPLPATLLFDQPTLRDLATLILRRLGHDEAGEVPEAQHPARANDDVAVIGLAVCVPGAPDAAAFWALLANGDDAVRTVPADRFDIDLYSDPDLSGRRLITTSFGGFLEHVDRFDAAFFGISPREAASMDPQQRLLLETAWQALEDAGIPPDGLRGVQAGVFVGISEVDYARRILNGNHSPEAFDGTGTGQGFAAGRIAYVLGLQGPVEAVDTLCSSSLVALHNARRALLAGECELAIVAGVHLMLDPTLFQVLSHAQALSPDGRCKVFDARADGYGRGEGCGVVVLKRLSDAQRDGDR
ncbi:MAG: AMP-binding protein, partial [Proteobacteria bacterium]|nr:AMP-binding protein [Pseudomonadota bacterium]